MDGDEQTTIQLRNAAGGMAMPNIKWMPRDQQPPQGERLLLKLSDAQSIGRSDVEVGYWDGNHFRFTRGQEDQAHVVESWARLEPGLPKKWKSRKAAKSD
jgi:hypothetical protein